MSSALKRLATKLVIVLAVAAVIYLDYPAVLGSLASVVKKLSLWFQFFGYAAALVLVPFFLWIMAEAGYKVFLRPSIRARHIRKIRDKRLRLEAAGRGGSAR